MERRALLRWIMGGAALWPLRGVYLHAQAATLSPASVVTLRALAPIVLPSSLGAAGHAKVVADFVQWLAGYRGGSERNWGYGAPRKSVTPSLEPSRYEVQLRELDTRTGQGATFARASTELRRAAVEATLTTLGAKSIPGSPNGTHVITDLMGFYFSSDAATDLVYRARVGRTSCRGLRGAATRPESIAGD